MRIELWYYEGGPHPDPPYFVGEFLSQASADDAAKAFQNRMTNPQFPYRIMWTKDTTKDVTKIKTLLQTDSKSEMEVIVE